MTAFRTLLVAMTALIAAFTLGAIADGGLDLITPFVTPILTVTWQGQFNVDFACYLVLSGVWMAWRGGFTRASIALGVLAPPLGIFFLAPYLLYLTVRTQGDHRRLLLGVHA
jgi:hypothetical protein